MSADPGISPSAYEYLTGLIYRHSRIYLGPHKQELVASRLRRRRIQLGLKSFDQYCDVLRNARSEEEIGIVIDLISTNHTHFFRERAHFDFLTQHALPALHKQLATSRDPVRCWSAASSSGEEVYTVGIVMAEFEREHGAFPWEIHGSDISTRMLEKAQSAIYELSRLELPSPTLLHRYFQKGHGRFEGHARVKDSIRSRVNLKRVNLFQTNYPIPPDQHLIFCRNVLIYFDTPSQSEVIRRLSNQLAPGGYLFIGHSESLMNIPHRLRSLGQGIFMKPR
jgi:chemotaxis protein methyltransferase CheR